MNITKISEKDIEVLNAYKKVDVCMVDGLKYPVLLRQNTDA